MNKQAYIKKVGTISICTLLSYGIAVAPIQAQSNIGEINIMNNSFHNTDLKIDGPYYYQMEEDQVKTDYKVEADSLARYEKQLSEVQAGKIKTVVTIQNDQNRDVPVKLITAIEDKDQHQEDILEVSELDIAKANTDTTIETTVKIPTEGNFEFKTYLWDDVNGMVPLKQTTILSEGATNLTYTYDGEYNRNDPRIVLSWNAAPKAGSYDIYVAGEKVGSTKETSFTMNLEPYTAYKINVQAVQEDGKNTAFSNSLYFMSEDTTASQDERMSEWANDRFGMFIHWGGYAAFGGVYKGLNASGKEIDYDSAGGGNGAYSEWIKFGAQIPDDIYKKTVEEKFTAENYDPQEWVRIAKDAGMKYIVLTSKHHEGLSLFNTGVENGWSAEDTAAAAKLNDLKEKDFLRELILEGAKQDIRVGVYYSQSLDWAQPGSIGWTPQRASNWSDEQVAALKKDVIASGVEESIVNEKIYDLLGGAEYQDILTMNENVILPQIEELMNMQVDYEGEAYGIDTLWWDMGQHIYPEMNYEIMKKVTELDPDKKIKMNNRILHEDTYTTMPFDFVTPEQSIPSAPKSTYWETCMTMNQNWGFAQNDHEWKQAPELIENLTRIASMGGNFLMNVGPKPDGSFPEEAVQLLSEVGDYMDVNGEAIYGTQKSPFLNDLPWGYATQKGQRIYLHVLDQRYLQDLIIPGLKSKPQSAEVITGNMEYSQPLQIERNEDYKGYQLHGDALTSTHAIGTIIVLDFDQTPILMEETNEKFPVMQDESSGYVKLEAKQAKVVSTHEDGLEIESGGNFGRWNFEDEYAQWKLTAKKPGTYSVNVNYATPMKGSLRIEVKDDSGNLVGRAKAHFAPSSDKDAWVSYKDHIVGSIDLPSAGNYTVEIHRENSGPDGVQVENGPVNIRYVEMKAIQEYELKTIEADAVSKEVVLTSQDGLRSSASGFVAAPISYDMKHPASLIWKVSLPEAMEYKVSLHGATGGTQAVVKLTLLDESLQPITKDGLPISISQTVQSSDWGFTDMDFSKNINLIQDAGAHYVRLDIVSGTMNVEKITLQNAAGLEVSHSNIVMDKNTTTQNITANKAIRVESEDSALVSVEKVNDKEWKLNKVASGDVSTSITVIALQDESERMEIPVSIFEGVLDIIESENITEPPSYMSVYAQGEANLEQEVGATIGAKGSGLYRFSMQYRSDEKVEIALGVDGNWKSKTLPVSVEWSEAVWYTSIEPTSATPSVIVKPIDNINEFEIANPLDITAIKFVKVGNSVNYIKNETLSNLFADWNHPGVEGVGQNSKLIRLRAYDAQLDNVETIDITNNIELQPSESNSFYGKLGNWWDFNDRAHWPLKINETGYYRVKGYGAFVFNDSYMQAEIVSSNPDNTQSVAMPIYNGGTNPDMGLVYLTQGEHRVNLSRKQVKDDVIDAMGLDFELVNDDTMESCKQDGKKFDCSAGLAVRNGKSTHVQEGEASYWNDANEVLTWRMELSNPQNLNTVLHYASDEDSSVSIRVKDSQGNIVLSPSDMSVTRMSGWGSYGYRNIGPLDMSGLSTGTYYLELRNTGGKGINLKNLILE